MLEPLHAPYAELTQQPTCMLLFAIMPCRMQCRVLVAGYAIQAEQGVQCSTVRQYSPCCPVNMTTRMASKGKVVECCLDDPQLLACSSSSSSSTGQAAAHHDQALSVSGEALCCGSGPCIRITAGAGFVSPPGHSPQSAPLHGSCDPPCRPGQAPSEQRRSAATPAARRGSAGGRRCG